MRILKQSSDAFRVNDPEVQDPDMLGSQFYDQTNPQVAMDLDGSFVVTWESVVPDSANYGSVSDIFARRFSPAGWVDDRLPGHRVHSHRIIDLVGRSSS